MTFNDVARHKVIIKLARLGIVTIEEDRIMANSQTTLVKLSWTVVKKEKELRLRTRKEEWITVFNVKDVLESIRYYSL